MNNRLQFGNKSKPTTIENNEKIPTKQFQSKFIKKSDQKTYSDDQEPSGKVELGFLNKTNEEERLALQKINPIKIQGKKEREKISLISFINCYKFLSPIVRKVSVEKVSEDYISTHVAEANKFALTIADKLKVNPINNKWFINCLERIYIETYVDVDKKSIVEVENEIDYESLINVIQETIYDDKFFQIDEKSTITDINLKIETSFLSNFNKMLTVYNKFDFYTNKKEFLKDFALWLRQFSEKKLTQKIGQQSLLNPNDKAIFYQSLLNEITINFIEIWKIEANRFVSTILSDETIKEEWLKNHPKGFYYKEFFERAEKQINDIFNLTNLVIREFK